MVAGKIQFFALRTLWMTPFQLFAVFQDSNDTLKFHTRTDYNKMKFGANRKQ